MIILHVFLQDMSNMKSISTSITFQINENMENRCFVQYTEIPLRNYNVAQYTKIRFHIDYI